MARPRIALAMKRAALVAVSTLLALGLGELTLRVLDVGEPVLRDVDPILGWAPIPGAEGWHTREGRAHVRITEHGFRGVTVGPRRPAGTIRVAILGDSYTEARQVALADSYPVRLERALSRCADAPVEVLAFGVSGYGTAQERLLLRERVWPFDPDVVLVAFLTGNDVADNHPGLRVNGAAAPTYRLEDGALVLDTSFRSSAAYRARADGGPLRWLRMRSRLVRLLSRVGSAPRERAGRGELGLRDEVYAPPPDATWRDAWARTEALLAAMHRDVTARERRFGVVTLSNAVQVDPDPAVRARFRDALGVDDLFYPDRRVAALGAREGFDVITLASPLRAYAEAEGVHLHGFENTAMGAGHWNEVGHRIAADLIAAWLCPRLPPAR